MGDGTVDGHFSFSMKSILGFPSAPLLRFRARGNELALDARHVVFITTERKVQTFRDEGGVVGRVFAYNKHVIPVTMLGSDVTDGLGSRPMIILALHRRYVAIVVDKIGSEITITPPAIQIFDETDHDPQNLIHGKFQLNHEWIFVLDVERLFAPILRPTR